MKVQLISYSKINEDTFREFGINISDMTELVAFCARVSNPSNQMNVETSDRLLDYLMRNQHWSPFEMVSACLSIETTRDIARQILRHRSFSFQEFSQRYANPLDELEFELKEVRLQDHKNRQNSIEVQDQVLEQSWQYAQYRVIEAAKDAYKRAIDKGIAKEQARAVLPEGLIQSKLYMNGTLRSWFHYIQLRAKNGTQKEHRDIAIECANVLEPIFPIIKKAI
jgi:thymidylate synthase (FAD)